MRGLVPRIHANTASKKTWMPATSAGMTWEGVEMAVHMRRAKIALDIATWMALFVPCIT
jgi:hypothetical protein